MCISRRRYLFLSLIERELDIVALRITGPYPTPAAALAANRERLRISDSAATVTSTADITPLLPGLLELAHDVESVEVNGDEWTVEVGVVFPDPEELNDVATWDNGDDYSRPGGDYQLALRSFGRHYVRFDDRRWDEPFWQYVGEFTSNRAAVDAWSRRLPPRAKREIRRRFRLPSIERRGDASRSAPTPRAARR